MDNYYYFKLIKKTTLQFLNIFNNIKIAKYDTSGDVIKYINVPLKLSSKQKFYYGAHDRKHEKRYPAMAVNFIGIDPDYSTRGTDSNYKNFDSGISSTFKKPIPGDYNFELYITTEYLIESEQILEQILPFFSPYIMINVNIPEINNNLDLKVICNSASQDKSTEMAEDEYRTINGTLDFRVKGYLLKPISDIEIIKKIYLNFKNYDDYGTDTQDLSGNSYETLHVGTDIEERENGDVENDNLGEYEIL